MTRAVDDQEETHRVSWYFVLPLHLQLHLDSRHRLDVLQIV